MVELAVSLFNEFLAATSDCRRRRCAGRSPRAARQVPPRSRHKGFTGRRSTVSGFALSVGSDEQWAAFRKAVGDPVALREADLRIGSFPGSPTSSTLNRIIDDHLSLFRPDEIGGRFAARICGTRGSRGRQPGSWRMTGTSRNGSSSARSKTLPVGQATAGRLAMAVGRRKTVRPRPAPTA